MQEQEFQSLSDVQDTHHQISSDTYARRGVISYISTLMSVLQLLKSFVSWDCNRMLIFRTIILPISEDVF